MNEEEDAGQPEGMDNEEYARWKEIERLEKEDEEAERALFEHLLSECQDPVKFRALALMELRKIRKAIKLARLGIESEVSSAGSGIESAVGGVESAVGSAASDVVFAIDMK